MAKPQLYHLLQLAAQRARKHADQAGVAAAGVTATQGGVLFVIEGSPGVSQRELARALGQQETAVPTMVSRLLAAGLVTRALRADNTRISSLHLSEKGTQALGKLRSGLDHINRHFEAALEPGDVDALAGALDDLGGDWMDGSQGDIDRSRTCPPDAGPLGGSAPSCVLPIFTVMSLRVAP